MDREGCSSRSSVNWNNLNKTKLDLKRSVIRSEVGQALEEYLLSSRPTVEVRQSARLVVLGTNQHTADNVTSN